MVLYYDKAGKPLETVEEWSTLFEDDGYRIVRQESTFDDKYEIFTAWIGIDHSLTLRSKRPVIFETMVFKKEGDKIDYDALQTERYTTEEEAIKGHERLFREYNSL